MAVTNPALGLEASTFAAPETLRLVPPPGSGQANDVLAVPRLNRHDVLYQVFLTSFNYVGDDPTAWEAPIDPDDPDFLAGNIPGLTAKVPYIAELGVDKLYVSPHYKGTKKGYHGYHTTDLKDVDPHFGTIADFQVLIDETHARGMGIISDFVPNHVSCHHPYFVEARDNPDSPYRDWFIFDDSPEGYKKFLGFGELAKLNLDHPAAMEYMLDAARLWLNMGLDGLRLDHAIGLSNQNLDTLVGTLRREYPGRAIIGEALLDGIEWEHLDTLRFPHKDTILRLHKLGMTALATKLLYDNYAEGRRLDGLLNFAATALLETYANSDDHQEQRVLRQDVIAQSQTHGQILLPTALDDHDRERALFRYGNRKDRLMRAATLQAELEQPMIIYYGTEIGMTQPMPFSARPRHADLLARQRMEWGTPDLALMDFYAKLIRSRKG